jgi:glucose-fructose oxidoreductase
MAVVGQGHFAQVAVLPAFRHTRHVELAALVSGDPDKLRALGDKFRLPASHRCHYDDFDRLMERGDIDAVYIAVPNDLHADFTVRAANHGAHVLCEKPMAPTLEECEAMIAACDDAGSKLMIAYRLHFEAANLAAVAAIRDGKIGEPRIFQSVFTQQVRDGNVRVQERPGAGPLFDMGVYCINAARYLFREDPVQVVSSVMRHPGDKRFEHVEETVAATLRFPGDRVAPFIASFGAADRARYEVIGTTGSIELENAYEYSTAIDLTLRQGDKTRRRRHGKRDQVAAEIAYFARCVRENRDPEPGGHEGMGDVRIMLAIHEAARSGVAVDLGEVEHDRPPTPGQEIHVAAHGEPGTVHVQSAGK